MGSDWEWASGGVVVTSENYDRPSNVEPVVDGILLATNPKNYKASVDALVLSVKAKRLIGNYDYSNKTGKDIHRERSDAMHIAAEKFELDNEKGVWKIGDGHVSEIKEKSSGHINYNLVSMDEFNPHFEEDLKLKNTANRSSLCTIL